MLVSAVKQFRGIIIIRLQAEICLVIRVSKRILEINDLFDHSIVISVRKKKRIFNHDHSPKWQIHSSKNAVVIVLHLADSVPVAKFLVYLGIVCNKLVYLGDRRQRMDKQGRPSTIASRSTSASSRSSSYSPRSSSSLSF